MGNKSGKGQEDSNWGWAKGRGVPRGDAQDARASPLPPCASPPPAMCIPPPPQPERLVMRKDRAVGDKKKCKLVYLNIIINLTIF
jgi:hypothetical protein